MQTSNKKEAEKKYYSSKSYWLETCNDDLTPREELNESKNVDIAILGAGFSGLWTAYYLIKKNPSLNIAIIEKDITGFGASGRNGGWCSPKFSVTPEKALKKYGVYKARDVQLSMLETVSEIEKVINEEKMNVDWRKGGYLQIARGDYAIPMLEKSLEVYNKLGVGDNFELLSKNQTERRVQINKIKSSLLTKNSAVLHPGKLVRQLANILEGKGVKIYEQTEVIDVKRGNLKNYPQLITKKSIITASIATIICGESYLSRIKKFHRNIMPMYSLITLTEPLSKKQWENIGWENREAIGSTRLSVDYLQKTKDGRILFGGRGQPYRFASKIKDTYDYHKKTHLLLQKMTKEWFSGISDIKFTHSWGGPVGVTRDWTPNLNFNKNSKIANVWGFAGQGVSTTNLAGRIMSDLILGKQSKETDLFMVGHTSKKWEIEPFRWAGVRYVQNSFEKIDKKSQINNIAPKGDTLAEKLGKN